MSMELNHLIMMMMTWMGKPYKRLTVNCNHSTTTCYNESICKYNKYFEPPRGLGRKLHKAQVQNNGIIVDNDKKQWKYHMNCIRRSETEKVFWNLRTNDRAEQRLHFHFKMFQVSLTKSRINVRKRRQQEKRHWHEKEKKRNNEMVFCPPHNIPRTKHSSHKLQHSMHCDVLLLILCYESLIKPTHSIKGATLSV